MPANWAEEPTTILLMATGLDPVMRWDGITPVLETAGIAAPTGKPALAGSGSGAITGDYTCYVRFLDRFGNVSNLSPVSADANVSNVGQINYSNVPVPTDPKVTRRQILRNQAGEANNYFVDVDTTDLTSTTFTSTRVDTNLGSQVSVTVVDSDGVNEANLNNQPPDWKSVVAAHLGRMFYAVDVPYAEGAVAVTFGSATVQGIGTEWTAVMANRQLYVVGGDQVYTVQSVDPVAQTLTLTANYTGSSDPFASYSIRPAPAERRLIYYSEAAAPESVPPINAVQVQEDGDEITGLMAMVSFLYVLEKRHIYRYTFQSDPAKDGYMFLAGNRGCINNRCWVVVEQGAYMLDEQGIHRFFGGQSEPLSVPIQEYFDRGNGIWRVNWSAARYFHAAYLPTSSVIRWFVCLAGHYLPRHALCYDFRLKRWWVEEYPFPVGSSEVGVVNNRPVLFLSGPGNKVYVLGQGVMDGPDPSKGTVRGAVGSATLFTITDPNANFSSELVGMPVSIPTGKGRGQQRIIASVTSTQLTVTKPWVVLPDSSSAYQVGGIRWLWRGGDYRFVDDEEQSPRRVELLFEPCTSGPATGTLRIYMDNPGGPVVEQANMDSQTGSGVQTTAGDTDVILDLTKSSGFVQKRFDGSKEEYIDGPRYVQAEFSGWSDQDPVILYQVSIDGAKPQG